MKLIKRNLEVLFIISLPLGSILGAIAARIAG